jgi:glycosyltransferase involved in cell wall biosynthesis
MLISIITVTRNDPPGALRTISSVLAQNYAEWELLICDGGSDEEKFSVIDKFCKKDGRIAIVSRYDHGIYDAMNKGSAASKGEFIIFLNGGDEFYDNLVLSDFSQLNLSAFNVIFGSVACSFNEIRLKKIRNGSECFFNVFSGKMPPHQGMFINRIFFNQIGCYDTSYRIVGDFDLYLRIKKNIGKFIAWDRLVSVFDLSGVSSTAAWSQEKERLRALIHHRGFLAALLYLPPFSVRCLKSWLRSLFIVLGLRHAF